MDSLWPEDARHVRPERCGQSSANAKPFLDRVPAEIRLCIYQHVYQSSTVNFRMSSNNNPGGSQTCISLLLTCKTINIEALPIFLNETRFFVPEDYDVCSQDETDLFLLLRKISHVTFFNLEEFQEWWVSTYFRGFRDKFLNVTFLMRVSHRRLPFDQRQIDEEIMADDLVRCPHLNVTRVVDFHEQPMPQIIGGIDPGPASTKSAAKLLIYHQNQEHYSMPHRKLTFMAPDEQGLNNVMSCCMTSRLPHSWSYINEIETRLTSTWPHKVHRVDLGNHRDSSTSYSSS